MEAKPQTVRRRGRPPRQREDLADTRELLLRAGLEVLTEKGFSATGIDEILGRAGVPKGSCDTMQVLCDSRERALPAWLAFN